MESLLQKLYSKGFLDDMPAFVRNNIVLEVLMGSSVYGATTDESDIDIYAVCVPPVHMMFPYLAGEIPVFDAKVDPFRTYQQHHIIYGDKSYDVKVYSIVHFIKLALDASPNVIDTLFVPNHAVLQLNDVGLALLKAKELFVSKHVCNAYLSYAGNKVLNASRAMQTGKEWRKDMYHAFRAVLQAQQLATTGKLDLGSNSQALLNIRDGSSSGFDVLENMLTTVEIPKAEEARKLSSLRDVSSKDDIRKLLDGFIRPEPVMSETAAPITEEQLIQLNAEIGILFEMLNSYGLGGTC